MLSLNKKTEIEKKSSLLARFKNKNRNTDNEITSYLISQFNEYEPFPTNDMIADEIGISKTTITKYFRECQSYFYIYKKRRYPTDFFKYRMMKLGFLEPSSEPKEG